MNFREFIMACKTESKQFGDHEYSVTQWPADKSMLMKFRLAKAFGAPITSLVGFLPDSKKSKEEKELMETKAVSDGIKMLFESSSPEELVSLIKECVIGVSRDGTKITPSTYNEYFSGDDLMDIYKIFIFVIQVNYSNLFKGQLLGDPLAKVKGLL